ncbi:MAG: PIN domain-containing protein [Nocardioides sp.]|uniref:TA system VapC family ribonuclease toxin n=1 Tax=Nocardioides sp. TaxID=35761 RepID=UPI0039E26FBA
MKIVDLNVLLYAVDETSIHHRAARGWLDRALTGGAPVGFAWLVLVGFIRLSTHPSLSAAPATVTTAMDIVDGWLGARTAQVLHPGPGHATLVRELLAAAGAAGNLANDAHLAALAREHKATVVSFDSDFGRFLGVRWERPA